MRKTFPGLVAILLIFFGSECVSWSMTLMHDFICTENAEITGKPVQSKDLHEDLEKQLRSLLKDFEKLQKNAEEKMTKEILPYLRKEIERIRKWLKEFRLKREKEDRPERVRI